MLDLLFRHMSLQTLMWLVVAFPLIGAAINGALAMATARSEGPRLSNLGAAVGCISALFSLLACGVLFYTLSGLEAGAHSAITGPLFSWAALKDLVIDVGLKMDELSLVVALVVSAVSFLVHLYSVGYMWGDDGFLRFFALMNLFLAFMLLLVLADNLVLMFAGWEGVGLCSWLLISYWFRDDANARAGTKAFVINAIGDGGFLIGMFIIFGVMSASQATPASGFFNFETMELNAAFFVPVATALSLALFVGAVAKSAQIPLYVWLPDAMAGPTPVSALIHAATMVAAGVYMVARLNFIFALSATALEVIAVIGAATALLGAVLGLAENDLKRILAYSTISQLGYMFIAIGVGAFGASIFHLITHAFFKALLFLAAGCAIKALGGETDIRRMGGLKDRMPISAWTFVIAAVALAGIAPTSGFFSKDAILWQAFERGHTALWAAGFLGVGLTAFYIFRAAASVFFGEPTFSLEKYKRISEPSISMVVPTMVMASVVALGGFVGLPNCLGGSDHIGRWLGNIVPSEISRMPGEGSCGTKIVLGVITLLWSIHFSVLGWLIYAQKRDWPEKIARKLGPVARLVSHKFYVDEVYDRAVVVPIRWFSRRILWRGIDQTVVDGIGVEGTERAVGLVSALVSSAQTGILQHYLLYFLIGVVLIVALIAL
jgi:NADH-quinone oxidoreductase subunit L